MNLASVALILLFWLTSSFPAHAADRKIIFKEDFDGPDPLSGWKLQTDGGRIRIAEDVRDTSNHGLLMDDPTDDAIFSQNVASKSFSIAGHSGVRIAVDIYSYNDEVQNNGKGFDGVVLRVGDTVRKYGVTGQREQHLEFDLDYQLESLAKENDQIVTVELHQYDNFSVPSDGLFFDNLTLKAFEARDIYVEAPLEISEADPFVVTVVLSPPPSAEVVLNLTDYYGYPLAEAVYPAGASSAELFFPSFENNTLDGNRSRQLAVTDGYTFSSAFTTLIVDNDRVGMTLTIPDSIREGDSAAGQIFITAYHNSTIHVDLESSAPAIVTFSPYVEISYNNSWANFTIYTSKDHRVLADREIVVSAVIGSERVEKRVKILETESLIPTIAGPTNLVEGSAGVAFTIQSQAVSDQPVPIHLVAFPSTISLNPPTVTLSPGQSLGSFKVSVADDQISQSNRSFIVTAQLDSGYSSTLSGMIVDNDVLGFAFDGTDAIQADTLFSVGLNAVNRSGNTVESYSGRASVFLKQPDTSADRLLQENIPFEHGQASISLSLPYSAHGSLLLIRSSDGVLSSTARLRTFAKLIFAAKDLVYDPKRMLLYVVSAVSAPPGHRQSLTKINPKGAQVLDAVFLGGDPINMAITDNGQFLYVGLDAAHSVQRVELESFTPNESTVLTADSVWQNTTFSPYRLLAIPGRPLDFIVSQTSTSSSYQTTRVYRDGFLPASAPGSFLELAAAGAPDEFYSFSGNDYKPLKRLRLTSSGYEVVSTSSLLTSYGYTKITGQADLIFSNNGRVVDGLKMEVAADLQLPNGWASYNYGSPETAVVPDVARSRVFYAQSNSIVAFDTVVFQQAARTRLSKIGNIIKMARWGETGIALLTENDELVLLEDDFLVPSGPPTDLAVTITSSPQPVFLGEELTYSANIENLSDTMAHDVRLTVILGSGQTVKAVATGMFANTIASNIVTMFVGDMAAGARQNIKVTTVPTTLTTLMGTAGALTSSLDINSSNNKATAVVNVVFKSTPNSVNIIKMPVNDFVPEPNSGTLIASLSADAPSGLAYKILQIDPNSGLIRTSIPIPTEAIRLAVSDDGSTVYALSAGRTGVFQIDLAARQLVRNIVLSGTPESISEMKAIRGSTNSFVVGGASYGLRVFEAGTQLFQTSGAYNGDLVALLPDPELIFGFDTISGGDTFIYKVTTNGVAILVRKGGLLTGYFRQIKSDGYYVYGAGGAVVRADLMAQVGSFPVATVLPSQDYYSTIIVEPDRAGQRVYFARDKKIASFDSETYLPIRTVSFELPANFASLERWGNDGFAARLANGDLAIIRTDLISQTTNSIDLLLSVPASLIVTNPMVSISGQAFAGQGISKVKIGEKIATTTNGFTNWTVVIDRLTEGENVLNVTATAFGNPSAVRTVTRSIFYEPQLAAYGSIPTQWITAHFGRPDSTNALPEADPDHDGLSNVAELLFATDPLEADQPHFSVRQVNESQFYLDVIHLKSPNFAFVVDCSGDMLSWNQSDPRLLSVGMPPLSGSTNYVTESYRFTANTPTPVQFFRVRAVPK